MREHLSSISPVDGRYVNMTKPLQEYFSEYSFIKERINIELKWLIYCLNHIPKAINLEELNRIENDVVRFIENITINDAIAIKQIEQQTNHDVKAIEYYLKKRLLELGYSHKIVEFLHFGCTSEDINNLAYAVNIRNARIHILIPKLQSIAFQLKNLSHKYSSLIMLARTHGQPATPTTLGKEFSVYYSRFTPLLDAVTSIPIFGKFNGASGNYNAWVFALPELSWPDLCKDFVESLGLNFNTHTTQIESHDYIIKLLQSIMHCNLILINLCRDIWLYMSYGYIIKQKNANEIGSSTMPHKTNPIEFENAEGNLLLANALMSFMINQLPMSRLQRDLTDSTILRNIGVLFAHAVIGYDSLLKGLDSIMAHEPAIIEDLQKNPVILTEAIQTLLRLKGYNKPYELLKQLTDSGNVSFSSIKQFIDQLDIDNQTKQKLTELTVLNYMGLAQNLANQI